MNIQGSALPGLRAHNPAQKRLEKPTDYIGDLDTSGKDVVVAMIDSGISLHPDLASSIKAAVTFDPNRPPHLDEMGHGTATAGVITGSGAASQGEIKGVAPGAKLINLPVFTQANNANGQSGFTMMSALNWVVENKEKFNIRVLNISGSMKTLPAEDSAEEQLQAFIDPYDSAIRRVVEAGIVVVAAAGNEGPGPGTIDSSPSHHPEVITVGSLDTNGTPQDLSDDFVATHSSRGPTPEGLVKPDLLAPGVGILVAASENSTILTDNLNRSQLYEGLQQLPDQALLPALGQLLGTGQVSGQSFQSSQGAVSALLSDRMKEAIAQKPAVAQPAMALRLAGALVAKGAVDTQSDSYRQATAALRQGLEDLAPAPVLLDANEKPVYMAEKGTSIAAPIVSGIVAHMLEVNPSLTPGQVKTILKATARAVPGADHHSAGAGALDAKAAIQKAREFQPG